MLPRMGTSKSSSGRGPTGAQGTNRRARGLLSTGISKSSSKRGKINTPERHRRAHGLPQKGILRPSSRTTGTHSKKSCPTLPHAGNRQLRVTKIARTGKNEKAQSKVNVQRQPNRLNLKLKHTSKFQGIEAVQDSKSFLKVWVSEGRVLWF